MISGDVEVFQILASWAVTLPSVAILVIRDERRLQGRELERAWPPASRDAALFTLWNALGLPHAALLIHFTKTRRSLDGFALGVRLALAVNLLDDIAQLTTAATIDWFGP